MNKKFLSAILFGALMVTSTGTFVSCKDYDDEIDEINGKIDKIETTLADLKSQIGDKGVSSVTFDEKTGVLTVVDGDGSHTYTIKSSASDVTELEITIDGKDLKVGDKVVGQVGDTVAVKDGELTINGEATGIKVGQNAILTDNSNGVVTITLPDADGKMQTITLPTALAAITNLTYVENGASTYSLNWGKAAASGIATTWDGPKGAITAGQLLTSSNSVLVQVFPASADLSAAAIELVASDGSVAPVQVTATPYVGLLTRAASANGVWELTVEPTEDVTAANINNTFNEIEDYRYALKVNGSILTKYEGEAKLDAGEMGKITELLYNGEAVDDENKVPAGKTVTFTVDNTKAYDAYLTTKTPADFENKGIEINGKTMTITTTDAAAGQTANFVVVYVDFAGKKQTSNEITVTFAGTAVDPDVAIEDVKYTVSEEVAPVIIDLGTTFTGLSAATAAKLAAGNITWSVASENNVIEGAEGSHFAFAMTDVKYYSALKADGSVDDSKVIDMATADAVKSAKYAVFAGSKYQNDAVPGKFELKMSIKDNANVNELKTAIVDVEVSLPAFDALFTKSATAGVWSDKVLNACLNGAAKKYDMTNAFTAKSKTSWANLTLAFKKISDEIEEPAAKFAEGTQVLTMADELLKADGTLLGNAKLDTSNSGYEVAGIGGYKVAVPEFEVSFYSPFKGASFEFYKDNVKTTAEVELTAGKGTIAGYVETGAGENLTGNGLKLIAGKYSVSVNNKAEAMYGGIKLATSDNFEFSVTGVNAASATAKIDAAGIVLEDMKIETSSYEAEITLIIKDINGITTKVTMPVKCEQKAGEGGDNEKDTTGDNNE